MASNTALIHLLKPNSDDQFEADKAQPSAFLFTVEGSIGSVPIPNDGFKGPVDLFSLGSPWKCGKKHRIKKCLLLIESIFTTTTIIIRL
jgi:hypothetical protein